MMFQELWEPVFYETAMFQAESFKVRPVAGPKG
jgi:hypothetical protein